MLFPAAAVWTPLCVAAQSTTLAKKKNHHRGSRREERCSTCDIMLDQARSAQGKSDPRLSATFALRWSRLIEHDITRGTAFFSPRISRMVLFFGQGCTSFLLLSIFRLHGCHFSGWGSRVGGLLISETSIFTIDNGDAARKGRTTEPWRSPLKKKEERFQKSTSALTKKSSGILFCTSTYRGICCRPLCIAPVQFSAKSSATGLCAHVGMVYVRRTPGANVCLWVNRQNHWFSREKGKLLSQGRIYLKLKC